MHSQKFRNGTKKWRKQRRKFHPYDLIFWKPPGTKWSAEFNKKLADKIDIAVNSGYIITAEELKSVIVIDTDDGTKGRHTFHEFDDAELLIPEGAIKYEQDESDEVCLR